MESAPQPFYRAVCEDGKIIIINENQVVSITEGENGKSIVRMSNGDELILVEPDFGNWEADCNTRKF